MMKMVSNPSRAISRSLKELVDFPLPYKKIIFYQKIHILFLNLFGYLELLIQFYKSIELRLLLFYKVIPQRKSFFFQQPKCKACEINLNINIKKQINKRIGKR